MSSLLNIDKTNSDRHPNGSKTQREKNLPLVSICPVVLFCFPLANKSNVLILPNCFKPPPPRFHSSYNQQIGTQKAYIDTLHRERDKVLVERRRGEMFYKLPFLLRLFVLLATVPVDRGTLPSRQLPDGVSHDLTPWSRI